MNDAQTWRSRHAHIRCRTRLAGYGGRRWLALGALGMLVCVSLASFSTWAVWADARVVAVQENEGDPPPKSAQFETKNFYGTIVWTAEVLESEFGISTAPETARNTPVCELGKASCCRLPRMYAAAPSGLIRDCESGSWRSAAGYFAIILSWSWWLSTSGSLASGMNSTIGATCVPSQCTNWGRAIVARRRIACGEGGWSMTRRCPRSAEVAGEVTAGPAGGSWTLAPRRVVMR